ncbi:TonB-dependent receptor [Candidatus Methylospira mobilis]|uniref:TonB-dependent receptor n=1 Tax=Candidatus Methylospira mobilis TaxID=1808979 RepID=A0A5Q0BL81_9GAMM|nr:TonB-dependent receptor [Candidatus Methylospira mobilis]QFY42526.1 TonB-dependent receptor [Candidatus Methylospira mobilis]
MRIPIFPLRPLLTALPLYLIVAPLHAAESTSTAPPKKPVPLFNRWFSNSDQPANPPVEKTAPSTAPAKTATVAENATTANNAGQTENTTPAQTESLAPGPNINEKPRSVAATHPVDAFELPEVEVVGNTPLGTTGLDQKKISGNVQTAEDEEIHRHEAFDLPDFMNRRLENVNINDVQNNPYQPNLTYRGFEASPLLGTPIGISAYQDGVRINEAFGDTVNWDLIPQMAIASMEMMPGSNPLFGLNTLGGALSIRTKSGFSHPGFHAQAYGGSYGRQAYQAEIGGSHGNFDWYFSGNIFDDSGWRPYSPTGVNQVFSKVGWEDERTDLDLSFTFADNNMQGVGPTPQNMLQQSWTSIYTAPDTTQNTMYFANLKGSHKITDELQLTGNVYDRNMTSNTVNSNTNQNCATWVSGTQCLDADGNPIIPGSLANTNTKTNGVGVNLQLTSNYKIADRENQLVVGGGYNYGYTNFSLASQDAVFTSTLYENAVSPLNTSVMIKGKNAYSNVFATDTFSIFDWLHANAAMNWMQAQVQTNDQLGTALNGNNVYARVNPSAGITLNPFDALSLDTPLKEFTAYFNYNEGFRAPTAVELSCADPNAPCSLPNAFVSDPPLQAVVSHTLEVGARGKFDEALKWNFALYQTRNTNDILYLNSPGGTTVGYFQNVGATQRQGAEMGLSGLVLDTLNWYLSYGFVDATYQTTAVLSNALGSETVTPGNRIPSIPQNTVKFGTEYEILHNWFFGGDLQYVSSQYARGDDQNIYPQIPSYTVVNLNTRYLITKNIELFAMGRNIFDQHYASFGQLGQNVYLNNQSTTFMGPGAPATGYGGIRVHWN